MVQPQDPSKRIVSQIVTALGEVNVGHQAWVEPIDITLETKHNWLELQLLPNVDLGVVCYPERWSRNRFEPVGRAFLFPASQVVHVKSNRRHSFSISCALTQEALQRWFGGEVEWTDRLLKQCLDIANPTIRNLLFRLAEELRTPGFASDALAELILAEVVIELARYCLGVEEHRSAAGGLAAWRVRLIDERLGEPGERPSLIELAELCNLSARQLTRAFRTSYGCSIGDYIAQNRINHAKLLLRTEQNVKTIAHTLGFKSPSHFYVAFHRATGETPREFRQRAGQEVTSVTVPQSAISAPRKRVKR